MQVRIIAEEYRGKRGYEDAAIELPARPLSTGGCSSTGAGIKKR